MKKRLDVTLAEKGLFPSRERAKAAIMAGLGYADGIRADKPGTPVCGEEEFEVRGNSNPYVSRGGLKLEKAIREFGIALDGAVCMDIGASTGGFTDCILKNGALSVCAVDVGYGQLDWKLRNDRRVEVMEKTNIRLLDTSGLKHHFDFISIDVSFISLKLVLPVAAEILNESGSVVCLVKPQFEAGRRQVGKNGVIRDKSVHKEVISDVLEYGAVSGFYPHGLTYSPVKGVKGNIEYLVLFKKAHGGVDENAIDFTIDSSHSELQLLRKTEGKA